MTQKLITADKDPNFLNRLEQRSRIVASVDALDHTVRSVPAAVSVSPVTESIIDPVTGKDINEPNPFVHPKPIDREPGFRPAASARKKPEKVVLKNRKGKEFETEAPFYYNVLEGQREYTDRRPRGVRIASDANGNPLTFATKPGEVRAPRVIPHSVLADLEDYGDDMAAVNEAAILRTRK